MENFNSTLVRLKLVAIPALANTYQKFQFYISTIKATERKSKAIVIVQFQFYISTIKAEKLYS